MAQECVETKDGLHIWEDHFYPEVVDPLTDEPVADGEVGELVFTSLTKQAMPVVRYRTRDLTRLLPGTARPGMRRMEKVTGRTDDMMIVRGVNVFPTQVEELVLGVPGLSPYFQCVLTRPGRLDELTVVVEADAGVPEASYAGLGASSSGAGQGPDRRRPASSRRRARRHRALGRQGPAHRRPAALTPSAGSAAPGSRPEVAAPAHGAEPAVGAVARVQRGRMRQGEQARPDRREQARRGHCWRTPARRRRH